MVVTLQPWSQVGGGLVGLAQGRTVAPSCMPRPQLTPRATGCSSGPGAGTCGTAAPGAGGERPGPLSRWILPAGGPRVPPTLTPSLRPTLLAASPLRRPRTHWSEGLQLPSTKPSATCGDTGEPGPWRAERRPAPRCRSRAPRDPPAAVSGVAAATGARGLGAGRTCSSRARRPGGYMRATPLGCSQSKPHPPETASIGGLAL